MVWLICSVTSLIYTYSPIWMYTHYFFFSMNNFRLEPYLLIFFFYLNIERTFRFELLSVMQTRLRSLCNSNDKNVQVLSLLFVIKWTLKTEVKFFNDWFHYYKWWVGFFFFQFDDKFLNKLIIFTYINYPLMISKYLTS